MSQGLLFESEAGSLRPHEPLCASALPEDYGDLVLWAVRQAVRRRLKGGAPKGMQLEDLVQEISILTIRKTKNWRPGGRFTLKEYCYGGADKAFLDFFRERKRAREKLQDKERPDDMDVMDLEGLLDLDVARDTELKEAS